MTAAAAGGAEHLVARAHDQVFALPLPAVIEIMRPQPLRPLAGAPPWLAGIATIRGEPVPVVDAATLLGGSATPARLVTLRVGGRTVALACTAVVGVRTLRAVGLPPLARSAAQGCIAALAEADGELCAVLETTRLLPADLPPLERAG